MTEQEKDQLQDSNTPDIISQLHKAKGFNQLSTRQKQFILESLKVQAKAHNGDLKAKKVIATRVCTDVIAQLEGYSDDMNVDRLDFWAPPDFFIGKDFGKQKDTTNLVNEIEKQARPCVVMLRIEKGGNKGSHAFVTLGKIPNNKVLVWEKIGPDMPFRVTTLDREMESYTGMNIIGLKIRQLQISPKNK